MNTHESDSGMKSFSSPNLTRRDFVRTAALAAASLCSVIFSRFHHAASPFQQKPCSSALVGAHSENHIHAETEQVAGFAGIDL
jgi:hypothetical protein